MPPGPPLDLPLVIVGSRLQTLILWGIAAGLAVGLRDQLLPWAGPLAAVLAVAGLAVFVRRLELDHDEVRYRRLIGGTTVVPRHEVHAFSGHRYLELSFDDSVRGGRIEVPVEIRPQVRTWAEGTGTSI